MTLSMLAQQILDLSLHQCGIKCRDGWYDPEHALSDEIVTCPHAGGHIDVLKVCEPYDCVSTEVKNSDRSSLGSIQGATDDIVTITCDEGYSGGGDVQCMPNGEFTTVTCDPNPCTSTQVQHSDRAATGSVVGSTGDTVTIICDYGYCVKGNGCLFRSAEAICEVDGRFLSPCASSLPMKRLWWALRLSSKTPHMLRITRRISARKLQMYCAIILKEISRDVSLFRWSVYVDEDEKAI